MGRGRPVKDPEARARAVALVDDGVPPLEALEHPEVKGRVGRATLYDALDRRKGKKASRRSVATGTRRKPSRLVESVTVSTAKDAVVEEPPARLSAQERRLWYVERQIGSVRQMLAEAETTKNLPRIGPLNEQFRKWLEVHAELQPPAPVDPHEEERKHEAASVSVLAKIEAGVVAAEQRAAA